MQARSDLSFFSTKKNPAPTGDEEGRIMPAAKESEMYVSIASRSGCEMLYKRLVGNGAPGSNSIAKSYGRWGGNDLALSLQKTSAKS